MLGTLEELPSDFLSAMDKVGVTPLWPMLRNLLPHGNPIPVSTPGFWRFDDIRPLLIRAGALTPVEKAERRVLVLSDPGRGPGAMQVTATIYAGLQLLLPGEVAPSHRHTPGAARIVVEGVGGYTVVAGEKLPMYEGDLVLTPGGQWHDHGHEGADAVIWLDALDLPLFAYLEGSYSEEESLQKPRDRKDASQVEYLSPGIVPVRKYEGVAKPFPLLRFPWERTEATLLSMIENCPDQEAQIEFVNPETGGDVLPALGFCALAVSQGQVIRPACCSSSMMFHVVKGRGRTTINGKEFSWGPKDTFSAPVFAAIDHIADQGPAFLYRVHDRPLQEKLGYYEERPQ